MNKRAFHKQSVRTCALLRQVAHFRRQYVRFSRGSTPQDKRRATIALRCLRRRTDDLLRVLGVAKPVRAAA